MTRRRAAWMWAVIFLLLFALSMDFWWWDDAVTFGPFHLPTWLFYFIALQLLLAAAIEIFTHHFWRNDDAADSEGEHRP